jgi:hypothetical protein
VLCPHLRARGLFKLAPTRFEVIDEHSPRPSGWILRALLLPTPTPTLALKLQAGHKVRPQTRNCIHQPPQGLNSSHPGCYHDAAWYPTATADAFHKGVFANVEKRPQSTNPPHLSPSILTHFCRLQVLPCLVLCRTQKIYLSFSCRGV